VLQLLIDLKKSKKKILVQNVDYSKLEKLVMTISLSSLNAKNPKACTILLRGSSKDVLNEMERNLHDCLAVARNIMINPKLVPGGGATEMELSYRLGEKAKTLESLE